MSDIFDENSFMLRLNLNLIEWLDNELECPDCKHSGNFTITIYFSKKEIERKKRKLKTILNN